MHCGNKQVTNMHSMIQQSIDTQVVIKEIETGRGLNTAETNPG